MILHADEILVSVIAFKYIYIIQEDVYIYAVYSTRHAYRILFNIRYGLFAEKKYGKRSFFYPIDSNSSDIHFYEF